VPVDAPPHHADGAEFKEKTSMRKLLFGLFGLVALAFSSLSLSAPAEAQPYYWGPGHRWDRSGVPVHIGGRPRPVYRTYFSRPYRAYRPYRS